MKHVTIYAAALPAPCPLCRNGQCTLDVVWDEIIERDEEQDDPTVMSFRYVLRNLRPSFIFCHSCDARMNADPGETVQEMVTRWYRQLGTVFMTVTIK